MIRRPPRSTRTDTLFPYTTLFRSRLHIFHLLQTILPNTSDLDGGVPARGLHGEAYRGHVFWDELFILPFLNFHLPEIARRSEEHTSELQSLMRISYAVFCLKKKKHTEHAFTAR